MTHSPGNIWVCLLNGWLSCQNYKRRVFDGCPKLLSDQQVRYNYVFTLIPWGLIWTTFIKSFPVSTRLIVNFILKRTKHKNLANKLPLSDNQRKHCVVQTADEKPFSLTAPGSDPHPGINRPPEHSRLIFFFSEDEDCTDCGPFARYVLALSLGVLSLLGLLIVLFFQKSSSSLTRG